MRSDTLAGTPAVRPQSEEWPHPSTPSGDERDAQSSQTGASEEAAASEDRSAVPCSLEELEHLDIELGVRVATRLGTENLFGPFVTKGVIAGRCAAAGHPTSEGTA